jgi:hypothetical protein
VEFIISLGTLVGTIVGIALTVLVHWLAPPGTDITLWGAWLIGLGVVGGLVVEVIIYYRNK